MTAPPAAPDVDALIAEFEAWAKSVTGTFFSPPAPTAKSSIYFDIWRNGYYAALAAQQARIKELEQQVRSHRRRAGRPRLAQPPRK